MAGPARTTTFGGTDPLVVKDVEVPYGEDFMADDKYEVRIVLNRAFNALEYRVLRDELHLPGYDFGMDYIWTTKEFGSIVPAEILRFLEELNARVSQRRDESAKAQERLNAQGEKLMKDLQPGG